MSQKWTDEEDELLLKQVKIKGEHDWIGISSAFLHRNSKQCRERYVNYVKPTLDFSPLSVEEQNKILELQKMYGNKWTKIAKILVSRSPNQIKNYWYSTVRNEVYLETPPNINMEKEAAEILSSLKYERFD